MSHPVDRRERFLIGKHKGERRVPPGIKFHSPEDEKRWYYRRRNTTAVCSCSMCGNPRRNDWNKGRDKLTMKEQRFKNWKEDIDTGL
jgi:hypothetical protein